MTTDATRAASDDELLRLARARRAEALAAGITHQEIKSGYGLDVESEERLCRLAARADRRRHLPRRPPRPGRVRGPRRRLRRRSSAARCSRPAPRTAAGSTSSARTARSTPTSRARCSRPAARPGSACACTATSSAPATACGSPSRWARPRSTTAPTSSDADIEALAGSETVATFLPATDFSTRQPYPDARRAIDAGVSVAIATNTNPGSSYHDLDVVLHRPRRPRHGDDDRGGAAGGDARRRPRPAPRATSAACLRAHAPTRSSSTRRRTPI